MSFPSVNASHFSGISADGIRIPANMQIKRLRADRLHAVKSITNVSETKTVTATGAFVGSVTARLAFTADGDRVAITFNPIASTAEAAAATISVAALIPAKFRPSASKTFFVKGTDNSAAATLLVTIASTGNVTIAVGAGGSAFAGTGNLSMEACQGIYSLRE